MIERKVRRAAVARGLDEAITWSFIGEKEAALFGGATHASISLTGPSISSSELPATRSGSATLSKADR